MVAKGFLSGKVALKKSLQGIFQNKNKQTQPKTVHLFTSNPDSGI